MVTNPSTTASNGRGQLGRFALGNSFAKGNPHASKVQKLRAAMLEVVTEKDVKVIVLTLIGLAEKGDLKAAKMILDLVGKPEGDAGNPTPDINEHNFQEVKNELLARCN